MVYNKPVTVEWTKRDRYGRIVGKVLFLPTICATPACLERTDANYQQIAAGMARESKRGLWVDAKPVAPWEWRRKR